MKRVAIFGSPGSGKSTLTRRLSALTGIPAIHLDGYYFDPGWVAKPGDEYRKAMTNLVATDRIDRADTLILLDCPRWLCLWRVVRRLIWHYGKVRPDQAPGCYERFDWDFLMYVWHFPVKKQRIATILASVTNEKTVLILRGKRDTSRFLSGIQTNVPASVVR